uniref:diadenylate cyclase n=1 Tax=Ruminococcus sp. TaxID=41978 RepID=UPI003A97EDFC
DDTIDAIVRASFSMGRAKTGALIVIEQKFVLNEYIATGILLDAIVSAPLLVQIFEHNLPLHDGAVVIRGNRITAATCYLPLSENKTISKELGTRHRAGLGISEVTDALTVIVSEETGQVSLTKDGQLYRNVNSDKLRELLGATKSSEKTQTVWDRLRKGRKRHEK